MQFSPTLINTIEVLMVLVPALLSIAYVTIAERKSMASMQRRIGPNSVGVYGSLQPLFKYAFTRSFHTTSRKLERKSPRSKKNNRRKTKVTNMAGVPQTRLLSFAGSNELITKAINGLYRDRISPVLLFIDSVVATCPKILNPNERRAFFKTWGKLGGIYLVQYKHDPRIFYIGRTIGFATRLRAHLRSTDKDKFHLFGRLVG